MCPTLVAERGLLLEAECPVCYFPLALGCEHSADSADRFAEVADREPWNAELWVALVREAIADRWGVDLYEDPVTCQEHRCWVEDCACR